MGAIYMVLTFSIMVPMALLTDAIINYLSAELQTNDADIQSGIQASLVKGLLEESCQKALERGIEEVMVGDAKRSEEVFGQGKVRYFILNIQPYRSGLEGPAYVLRGLTNQVEQPALSLSNVLPLSGGDCPSDYQAPAFMSYDVCRVDQRRMLSRRSADWRWQWLADGETPNTNRDYLYCPKGLLLTRK